MNSSKGQTNNLWDERIIEISSRMYDLSMLLSRFMIEMLEISENYSLTMEADVPLYDNDGYIIFRIDSVCFDRESGEIMVCNSRDKKTVAWNSLDVVAMDTLVNAVHMKRKADDCYRQMKESGASLN